MSFSLAEVQNILGWGDNFFGKKNRAGHNSFDDQNVGSQKMTIMCSCLKQLIFNTILACLGSKLYQWGWSHKIFVAKIGGGYNFDT